MSSVDKIESEVAASVTPTTPTPTTTPTTPTPTTTPVRKSDFYFTFNHILMKRSRLE